MPKVAAIELFELDLPFRRPFRHAAAERDRSRSLFARCVTDTGHEGYGETLPRPYVTGEDRGAAFDLLSERILPRLLDVEFASLAELHGFLARCDGKAPCQWVQPQVPQTAAWCLVDLALLDAFSRALGGRPDRVLTSAGSGGGSGGWPERLRYGVVLSRGSGGGTLASLLRARAYGIRDIKVKVDRSDGSLGAVRSARRILGRRTRVRVDANTAWSYAEARSFMASAERFGVESVEQPLSAGDLDGMARLVRDGVPVTADESFHDADSLERLIARRACTGVSVRIAKCGGLVASLARCRRALDAGLVVQVSCQVGETSQLSAAQIALIRAVGEGVTCAEGCFGERLLVRDPVRPCLQFRRGGRPPAPPPGLGFGTTVDLAAVRRHAGRRALFGTPPRHSAREAS